ncbi:MAG: extracellular solute-binding protein [Proteobacteria bacterium]|nr:extracellular solute-binding protein [Pseudomonadota bacterium]
MTTETKETLDRRTVLGGVGAALGAALVLPGSSRAQSGRKPFDGVTLNVSCWNGPYPRFLAEYIPEFEAATGAKVNYDTPAFPVFNQRADLELSTGGSAFDVLNVTFIYSSRWIRAGWLTPLDGFIADRQKTPADWDGADFLAGLTSSMRDQQGRLHGIPWIADTFMVGTPRRDLIAATGLGMPDTFDEVRTLCQRLQGRTGGVPPFVTENNYGWTFIPWLQGFGGNVFRAPPDDLFPTLDSPEAVAAAEFFTALLREHAPSGVISMNYDQVAQMLKQGRAVYSPNGLPYLMQMAASDSRVAQTAGFSMMPAGPKGRFPGVGVHGWGIPAGAKNKDASWAFIQWSMSKALVQRMLVEKSYTAVTRRSAIESAEFKKQMTVNGQDLSGLYRQTIDQAASGYMSYRTVPQFPPLNRIIAIAIEEMVSGQSNARDAMRRAQESALAELRRSGTKL